MSIATPSLQNIDAAFDSLRKRLVESPESVVDHSEAAKAIAGGNPEEFIAERRRQFDALVGVMSTYNSHAAFVKDAALAVSLVMHGEDSDPDQLARHIKGQIATFFMGKMGEAVSAVNLVFNAEKLEEQVRETRKALGSAFAAE